jgi:hypothetical protein
MLWLSVLEPVLVALTLVALLVAIVQQPIGGMRPLMVVIPRTENGFVAPHLAPKHVVEAAQRGILSALAGDSTMVLSRLWAYEIEEAARYLLEQRGAADRIAVQARGETVLFKPAVADRERAWPTITSQPLEET